MSALSFTAPLLLWALLLLPILWWLMRAVPPSPLKERFPGIILLLGLQDDDTETDKTPWWLLALRMLALAAVIIGLAGPVLNPETRAPATGRLLIVMDASWASARDWPMRIKRVEELLSEAQRDGRPVAIQQLTEPLAPPEYLSAADWQERLIGFSPRPYRADPEDISTWAENLDNPDEIIWVSDSLQYAEPLPLIPDRVIQSPLPVYGLASPQFKDGDIELTALRAAPGLEDVALTLRAVGPGPNGAMTQLANETVRFENTETKATVLFDLPPELRNRVQRFEISGQRSAGAVALTDDALQRREVALLRAGSDTETQNLLDPLFYLRQALRPTTDILEGDLSDMLLANPDVLIFADIAQLSASERETVQTWVEDGGLLVRFAGPRLAALDSTETGQEDALLPVRLRAGGRSVGGALSWGEPKTLRPFSDDSPFAGLRVSDEVTVTTQIMAQPDPNLAARTIAALTDGTPLVTRKRLGQGQIVLFHVTANAEWSSLPLSGIFVRMLERLAVTTEPLILSGEDLSGRLWVPQAILDGFGDLNDASTLAGISGEILADGRLGPDLHAGLYKNGDHQIALNVLTPEDALEPATWPAGVRVEGLETLTEQELKPYFLSLAFLILGADIIASLLVSGRLRVTVMLLAAFAVVPKEGLAQTDAAPLQAATEITLAYVKTGDTSLDKISEAGLRGLSKILTRRTSVEPGPPFGVDIERDELSVYPLLYWPITVSQSTPSAEAYEKLNRYLRGGGFIVFDSRDADIGGFGQTPNGRKLQTLALGLDIPPLEVLPQDHVLTRSFYLLQDFPGRFTSRDLWVEATPEAKQVEGIPFRTLNDGVTPIMIGGNDWVAAWAVDESGRTLVPVGRGYSGEAQRELAYRFGVNLVMHVLSGNYKSDQVHVPALLDRLGQ